MHFYAVAVGREVGVYNSWTECELQVKGYKSAKFKKFKTNLEAIYYIAQYSKAQPTPLPQNTKPNTIIKNEIDSLGKNTEIPTTSSKKQTRISFEENFTNHEKAETSAFLGDLAGDEELLLALENLKEYPEETKTKNITNKRKNDKRNKIQNSLGASFKNIKIGQYNFQINLEGFVQVHISGKCEKIGAWNCIAGYGVYFGKRHPLNHFAACTGRITINIGDIEAGIYAIKTAKRLGIEKLCIITSSDFLLKCVSGWMFHWKRNDWRNKNGNVVQNRKELAELETLLAEDGLIVQWKNRRDYPTSNAAIAGANTLAEIGLQDYLEKHPRKLEDSFDDDELDFDLDFI